MDEKDQKIREMERELEGLRQEVDTLRQGGSPYRYDTLRQGRAPYQYDRRKPLKPWKIILIAVGVIFALVAVVLIAVFALMNSDKESTAMAEEILQAVVAQDADRAYALTYPGALEREEFDQGFEEMCRVWQALGGGEDFTMRRTSWSMNTSGGVTQYSSQYRVTSGGAQFALVLVRVVQGDRLGVIGAQITQFLPG